MNRVFQEKVIFNLTSRDKSFKEKFPVSRESRNRDSGSIDPIEMENYTQSHGMGKNLCNDKA